MGFLIEKTGIGKENKVVSEKGFTLVDLLVVVLIIAVLASIVAPGIAASAKDANVALGNLETKIKGFPYSQ